MADRENLLEARTLYYARCGWCGAYEGTVEPTEPCASDGEGYIGPHQFKVFEIAAADLLDEPDDLTTVYMVGVERGKELAREGLLDEGKQTEALAAEWVYEADFEDDPKDPVMQKIAQTLRECAAQLRALTPQPEKKP